MTDLNKLTAISPVDGRYRDKTALLGDYFSEYALIRYRVLVEVEYFIALCRSGITNLAGFPQERLDDIRQIYREFSLDDARRIKETEKITNHDVKAVEYFGVLPEGTVRSHGSRCVQGIYPFWSYFAGYQ